MGAHRTGPGHTLRAHIEAIGGEQHAGATESGKANSGPFKIAFASTLIDPGEHLGGDTLRLWDNPPS
jgi:hypothetical protein